MLLRSRLNGRTTVSTLNDSFTAFRVTAAWPDPPKLMLRYLPRRPLLPFPARKVYQVFGIPKSPLRTSGARCCLGKRPETDDFRVDRHRSTRHVTEHAGFEMLVNYGWKTAGLLPDDTQALGQRRPGLVQFHADTGQLDVAQVVAMDVWPRIRCKSATGARGSGHPGSPLRHRREWPSCTLWAWSAWSCPPWATRPCSATLSP